ncbi:transport permease protein [Propionigenium maris DSM 9537]|uniref:Transport permease protein n=1 Tax=Propionigenium maris DSM 9537 TaxID=1123000 RepID=A0A9W6LPB8_9FUSO|nr:ABC transporter permease [Propionigenium maris]GLI56780.1 transport permease protein [Propionigenium maris DSM 9537]
MLRTVNRFIGDLKKYKEYIIYSTKSDLKRQVAGTLFGYLWWLLDPLLHMFVYTILVTIIFRRDQPAFPLFVFCALLSWKWLTSSLGSSTTCIKRKAGIIRQIYLPKFVLPLIDVATNFVKFLFGIIILLMMMGIYRITPTWHMLEIVPILIVNFLFIYGISLNFAHVGALYSDFKNVISHMLRLWFYVSPGIYSLSRIPEKYRWVWKLNPITSFFESYRNVFMYGAPPMYKELAVWSVVSIIILFAGIHKIYKFDKNYAKVV